MVESADWGPTEWGEAYEPEELSEIPEEYNLQGTTLVLFPHCEPHHAVIVR